MTWGEFKELVEKEGVEDTTEVMVIDCACYLGTLEVTRNEENRTVSIW